MLVCLDYITSRVETAILGDMSTESVTSALHEILSTQGWRTKRISLDSGSSLVPAIVKTSKEIQEIAEEEGVQETQEEVDEEGAVTLVTRDSSPNNSVFQQMCAKLCLTNDHKTYCHSTALTLRS